MHHFRSTKHVYDNLSQQDAKYVEGCAFPSCSGDPSQPVVLENDTMYMIENRTTYDVFEGRRVLDHRMVIPKRHIETLANFTKQEKLDHMEIVAHFEREGYNVYARGVGSVTRSVKHQHTHLIKLSDKLPKGILYLRKPYFLMHI